MPTSRPTRSPPRAADLNRLPRPAPSPALLPVHQAIVTLRALPAACARTVSGSRQSRRPRFAIRRTGDDRCPGSAIRHARVLLIGLAPGRAWRQPHGPHVHRRRRRRVGRLPDARAARQRPRVAADVARRRTMASIDRRLHCRGGALRAARQQADARRSSSAAGRSSRPSGTHCRTSASSSASAASPSTSAGVCSAIAASTCGRVRRSPTARHYPVRRRPARDRRVSSEPPEHEHGPA